VGKDKILALSVVIFIFLVLSITNPGSFLSAYNMEALLEYATTYFVAGIGLTFVIMIGSIDLSIGSLLSLFTVLFVLFLNAFGFWAYPLVLFLGAVLGLANGIIFTRLKIPSFIGTFGAAGVYQSLALIVSRGKPIGVKPVAFAYLDFLNFHLGFLKGSHMLSFLLFVLFLIVQYYTPFGRYVYAVGNSEQATNLSGVRVARIKTLCFVISGLSSALASFILVARMFSGDPTVGAPYQLQVIAACVVGGTALTGGVGGIFNTLLGTFVVALIGNGLNVVGVDVYYQLIITGVITMVAVALTLDRSKVFVVK